MHVFCNYVNMLDTNECNIPCTYLMIRVPTHNGEYPTQKGYKYALSEVELLGIYIDIHSADKNCNDLHV